MGRARTGKGIFSRTNKRGVSRWIVPYKDADGKWRQKTAKSLRDARTLKVELDHQSLLASVGIDGVLRQEKRASQVASDYLRDLQVRVTPMTFLNARRSINRVVEDLGNPKIGTLRVDALNELQRRYSDIGLGNRTTNKIIGQFLAMLRWAEASGNITSSPIRRLRRMPTGGQNSTRRSKRLTEDECARLVDAARKLDEKVGGIPQAPLIETMLLTGFRWKESTCLRWGDLRKVGTGKDATWWITVRSAYAKTGEQRSNPIPRAHGERLLEHRNSQAPFIKHLATDEDFIHPTRDGSQWKRPINDSNCRRWFRLVVELAGLDKPTPDGRRVHLHALRGTYCTLLRERGIAADVAKELMGHKTFHLTMEIYTEGERIPRGHAADVLPDLRMKVAPPTEVVPEITSEAK